MVILWQNCMLKQDKSHIKEAVALLPTTPGVYQFFDSAGKVIYVFEDVDLVKAKEILGDVACIAGGMPTEYLMFGDKQRVIDHTKRMIDTLAPGGGYIMSNTQALDQVKMENMEAWKDTVFSYGKYNK